MNKKNVQQVVQCAIAGEAGAFDKLCELIAKDILYICIKIMGNRFDGEDAAQETYIKMQKGIGALEKPEAFEKWIYRVIASACNNVKRSKIRMSSHESIDDHSEELLEEDEGRIPASYVEELSRKEIIIQAVEKLPENYRKIVILYYYEGMTQKDIAQICDISRKSVERIIYRAKKLIRQHLEKKKDQQTIFAFTATGLLMQLAADSTPLVTAGAIGTFVAKVKMAAKFVYGKMVSGATLVKEGVGGASVLYKSLFALSISGGVVLSGAALVSNLEAQNIPVVPTSPVVVDSQSENPPQVSFPVSATTGDLDINVHSEAVSSAHIPPSSLYIAGGGIPVAQNSEEFSVPVPSVATNSAARPPYSSQSIASLSQQSSSAPAPVSSASQASEAPPPPSSSSTPQQNPEGTHLVQGEVVLVNQNGEVLPGTPSYLNGLPVHYLENSRVVATTTTFGNGNYCMWVTPEEQTVHEIIVELPAGEGLYFSPLNPGGRVKVTIDDQGSDVFAPTMYVYKV